MGGAGRALDADVAFAARGFAAGGALGVNQAADTGPQTRAKAAIRVMRTNMKERNKAIRKGWLKFILRTKASPCDRNPQVQRTPALSLGGHDTEILISREDTQAWRFRGRSSIFPAPSDCNARIPCYTAVSSRLPAPVRRSEPQERAMSDHKSESGFQYSITNLKPPEPEHKITLTFPDGASRQYP